MLVFLKVLYLLNVYIRFINRMIKNDNNNKSKLLFFLLDI